MAIPVFDSSGAVAIGDAAASLEVDYPATINTGDRLILTFGQRNSTVPNDPTGFTIVTSVSSDATHVTAVWEKTATGSETGSETVTPTAGSLQIGRMHRFTGVSGIEAVGSNGDSNTTALHPDITTTAADRIAVAVTFVNDSEPAASFTGETGGDFTLAIDNESDVGQNGALSMQTADMASPATISGGSWTWSGAPEDWGTVGFALFGEEEVVIDYLPIRQHRPARPRHKVKSTVSGPIQFAEPLTATSIESASELSQPALTDVEQQAYYLITRSPWRARPPYKIHTRVVLPVAFSETLTATGIESASELGSPTLVELGGVPIMFNYYAKQRRA